MRLVLSLAALCLFSLNSIAQRTVIPNTLFDHWYHIPEEKIGPITYPEYHEPAPNHFWTSGNPSTRTIAYDPTLIRTTDAYEGDYAVLLRSTKFQFGIAAGGMMTGRYVGGLDPSKVIDWGVAWNGRPERFVGYYKYIPVDNDKCRGYAIFTKYNGSQRDTVGEVWFTPSMESDRVDTWTKFDIPVTYYSNDEPDTIIMALSSSFDGQNYNGGDGSSLYLDRLMMLYPGETSVNYTDKSDAHFWVYPNPATDFVNFTIDPEYARNAQIRLYNEAGAEVKYWEISEEFNRFSIEDLPAGAYTYTILQSDSKLTQGRLIKP